MSIAKVFSDNMPEIKLGIIAVSRDCFPMSLSESRRAAVVASYQAKYGEIYEEGIRYCPVRNVCGCSSHGTEEECPRV